MLMIFALATFFQETGSGYYRVSDAPPAFIQAASISAEGDVVSFVQLVLLPQNQADLPVAFEVDTQVNCATLVHRSTQIREILAEDSVGRVQEINRGWRDRSDDVQGWFDVACTDRASLPLVEGGRKELIAPLVEARTR